MDNTLRQQQLAEAMLAHYRSGGEEDVHPGSIDYNAHVAVIEGVIEALGMLKKRNCGRYTREDKITQQVLLSAALCKAKCKKVQRSIARLLQVRPQSIAQAKARMEPTWLEKLTNSVGAVHVVRSQCSQFRFDTLVTKSDV